MEYPNTASRIKDIILNCHLCWTTFLEYYYTLLGYKSAISI